MSNTIILKKGTQAQLDIAATAGELHRGEPYFIDDASFKIGTGTNTYVTITDAHTSIETKTTHGFVKGNLVYFNGTTWLKSKADTVATSEIDGIVIEIKSADTFKLARLVGTSLDLTGVVDDLSGALTASTTYYLSTAVAGKITATKPSLVGVVSNAVIKTLTTTTGVYISNTGYEIVIDNFSTQSTISVAELTNGLDNDLMYCVENESFYRYEVTGGAYTRNGTTILNTLDAGNTRWLAVAGKYNINGSSGGDMILASVQSVTGLKTFDKNTLAMKGTSTGTNTVSVANTSVNNYTNILPAKDGTFAMISDIASSQSGGCDLATNGTIKFTIPVNDGDCTGNKTNAFNCGYTSSAIGDLVYLDSSSTWQKADKGTSVATYGGFLAIALEVKTSGNPLLVALPGSFVYATAFPTLTIGAPVYMDDVGAIVVARPAVTYHAIRIVGYAIHADKIYFNPSSEYIIYV